MFDQFLASKGLLKSISKIIILSDYGSYQVVIEIFDEMKSGGDHPSPILFGRPAEKSSFNPKGFSDHYPISVLLEEQLLRDKSGLINPGSNKLVSQSSK